MKLYDMKLAPNPRRVRIFIAEKGIDNIERIEIDIARGENLEADYLEINPRGLLPTLVLDDGSCLDETIAICRYLEDIYPDPNLMGASPLERVQIESAQRHIEFDGFIHVADVFRNTIPIFAERAIPGQPARYPAIPELAERGRLRFRTFLDDFNQLLADRPFVAGGRFTIADITALCAVDFARAVKIRLGDEQQHAKRWYDSVSSRPSASE